MVSVTLTISFLQPPNSNDITVLLIHSEQWFTKCRSQTSRKGDVITRNADPQATHQIYWTRSWFSPRCLNKPTRWSWRTPRWDTTHVRMLLQTRIPEWVAMSSSRGIFPTQGQNPRLPHCRQTFLLSEPARSPRTFTHRSKEKVI